MDPITAVILGGVLLGTSLYAQDQQRRNQLRMESEQRQARDAQVRREIGIANQTANRALGNPKTPKTTTALSPDIITSSLNANRNQALPTMTNSSGTF